MMLRFVGGPAHGHEVSAEEYPTKYVHVPRWVPGQGLLTHVYERSGDLLLYIDAREAVKLPPSVS